MRRRGEKRELPLHTLLANMMIFSDPPKHTRLRALIAKAFTPKVVEAIRPAIQRTVDSLLGSTNGSRMEVIEEFAYPFPVIVICEMLDLPVSDRVQLKQWSDDIVSFSAGVKSKEQTELALKRVLELEVYLSVIIERCRHDPADSLLGALVTANGNLSLFTTSVASRQQLLTMLWPRLALRSFSLERVTRGKASSCNDSVARRSHEHANRNFGGDRRDHPRVRTATSSVRE